jgi:gamma-carbonic anhydrase
LSLSTHKGDVASVVIGDDVSIGDTAVIGGKSPTKIGNKVVIGSGAKIEGSTIEDGCFIGDGAFVANGSSIGRHSILMSGSHLLPNSAIPSKEIWAGSPAKFIGAASAINEKTTENLSVENQILSSVHARASVKRWEEVEQDDFNTEQYEERDRDVYYRRLTSEVIYISYIFPCFIYV